MDINVNIQLNELVSRATAQQRLARISRDEKNSIESVAREAKNKSRKGESANKKENKRTALGAGASLSRKPLIDDPAATRKSIEGLGYAFSNYRDALVQSDPFYTYCDQKYQEITRNILLGRTPTLPDYGGSWVTSYNEDGALVGARTELVSNHCGYLVPEEVDSCLKDNSLQEQAIHIVSTRNDFDTYLHLKFTGKAESSSVYQDEINSYQPFYYYSPYSGGPSTYKLVQGATVIEVTSSRRHNVYPGNMILLRPDMFFPESQGPGNLLVVKDPNLRPYLNEDPVEVYSVLSENKLTIIPTDNISYDLQPPEIYGPINFVDSLPDYLPQGTIATMQFPLSDDFNRVSVVTASSTRSSRSPCSGAPASVLSNADIHPDDEEFYYNDGYIIKRIPSGTTEVAKIFVFATNNAFQGGYFDFQFKLDRSPIPVSF